MRTTTKGHGFRGFATPCSTFARMRNCSEGCALAAHAAPSLARHHGTSKVHQLRHTFARMLEDAGAPLSEIQRRLGHTSPATTGLYMVELRRAEHAHAAAIARMLGLEG